MTATIKVPLEADYEAIALDAGAAPGTARYWNDGTVVVPDVTQESLDAALGRYNHEVVLAKRAAEAVVPTPITREEFDALKVELELLKSKLG